MKNSLLAKNGLIIIVRPLHIKLQCTYRHVHSYVHVCSGIARTGLYVYCSILYEKNYNHTMFAKKSQDVSGIDLRRMQTSLWKFLVSETSQDVSETFQGRLKDAFLSVKIFRFFFTLNLPTKYFSNFFGEIKKMSPEPNLRIWQHF